jgi:DNA-binding transcriptional LysR family regulator
VALITPQHGPPGLRARHLFDERYVLIGRRNHPRLRDGITIKEFAQLEHVIVSLRGGDFVTPVDNALAALGHSRNVVLSAASFLFVPEIVSRSDFVALVPERLIHDRADNLKLIACPLPVEGFAVGMVWHERSHGHSGHRWIREAIVALVNAQTEERKSSGARHRPHQRPDRAPGPPSRPMLRHAR